MAKKQIDLDLALSDDVDKIGKRQSSFSGEHMAHLCTEDHGLRYPSGNDILTPAHRESMFTHVMPLPNLLDDINILASHIYALTDAMKAMLPNEYFQPYAEKEGGASIPVSRSTHESEDDDVSKSADNDSATSVMMRNIPNNYTLEQLLNLMNQHGFYSLYNFVYLPIDLKRRCNVGYAFINFVDHEGAVAFHRRFTNFCAWEKKSSKKVCVIQWGRIQGWDAHVQRYRNSAIMHPSVPLECKPAVFNGGRAIPFPSPTKAIPAPQERQC